jgi:hypothetical protein
MAETRKLAAILAADAVEYIKINPKLARWAQAREGRA